MVNHIRKIDTNTSKKNRKHRTKIENRYKLYFFMVLYYKGIIV